jgi:hypothetical protein
MENPVEYLRRFLGKPAYTFKQCEFGVKQVKRTDLWDMFTAPKKTIKCPDIPKSKLEKRWGSPCAGRKD